jgi:hypothetical protein
LAIESFFGHADRVSTKILLLVSALSFFFVGLSYSSLIMVVEKNGNVVSDFAEVTLGFLFFYQLGKAVLGFTDSLLSEIFKKRYLSLAVILNFLALGIVFRDEFSFIFKKIAAIVLGATAVAFTVTLRDHLTKSQDLWLKKFFNTVTMAAWSLGVGLYSVLASIHTLFWSVCIFLLMALFFLEPRISHQALVRPPSAEEKNAKFAQLFHLWRSLRSSSGLFKVLLLTGFLLYTVVVNLTNSSIVLYLKTKFSIPEASMTLIFLLPIVGSILSLAKSSQKFLTLRQGFSPINQYKIAKFLTLLCVSILFWASNIILFCILLVILGYCSNEENALGYQLISQDVVEGERRGIHAGIEILGIVGTGLAWLLKTTVPNLQLNFLFLLVGLIVWVSLLQSRASHTEIIS